MKEFEICYKGELYFTVEAKDQEDIQDKLEIMTVEVSLDSYPIKAYFKIRDTVIMEVS